MSDFTRRRFLKGSMVGVGVTTTVAGCNDDGSTASSPPPRHTEDPVTPPGPPSGGGQPPAPMGMNPGTNPPPTMQPPPTGNPPPGMQQPPPNMPPPPAMEPPPMTGMPPTMMGTAGMPLRALGKTGLMVSIVGFGSGSQYLRASEADADRIIQRAIELGINYFDTAASYGNGASEKRLGKYLVPRHRAKIVLVSKSMERTAEGAKRELDTTLQNLGTDKLDIFHFHELGSMRDTDAIMAKGGAYEVYARAKEQGVIRFIGLTGHSTSAILIDAMKRIKPDVMMCPQNAAREAGFTDMVIPFGQQAGIGLLGMKVTAQNGLLRNGVTAEELVKYSLSLPVSSMIIGMRSLAVIDSCATIAKSLKPLTPAEMMDISGKLASLDLRRALPYHRWGYRDGLHWG